MRKPLHVIEKLSRYSSYHFGCLSEFDAGSVALISCGTISRMHVRIIGKKSRIYSPLICFWNQRWAMREGGAEKWSVINNRLSLLLLSVYRLVGDAHDPERGAGSMCARLKPVVACACCCARGGALVFDDLHFSHFSHR